MGEEVCFRVQLPEDVAVTPGELKDEFDEFSKKPADAACLKNWNSLSIEKESSSEEWKRHTFPSDGMIIHHGAPGSWRSCRTGRYRSALTGYTSFFRWYMGGRKYSGSSRSQWPAICFLLQMFEKQEASCQRSWQYDSRHWRDRAAFHGSKLQAHAIVIFNRLPFISEADF